VLGKPETDIFRLQSELYLSCVLFAGFLRACGQSYTALLLAGRVNVL